MKLKIEIEVEIKTFWRRWVFNLENTFWTSIKHCHLSPLKALWRRFEGSISKSFKRTVQTSSGRITWGRGEDILQTGVFFNLKNDLWTWSKISTWANWRRKGAFWRLIFQMVSRHLANVFISYDLKLRYRRSGDGNFFNLKYAFQTSSKHFGVSNLKALRRRTESSIFKDLECTL